MVHRTQYKIVEFQSLFCRPKSDQYLIKNEISEMLFSLNVNVETYSNIVTTVEKIFKMYEIVESGLFPIFKERNNKPQRKKMV